MPKNGVRAARLIAEREPAELVAVQQDFQGPFSGRALLIFPGDNSFELARAVTSGALSAALNQPDNCLSASGGVFAGATMP